MSPHAAWEYLTTKTTWLQVTPDCENGSTTAKVND